MKPPAHSDLSTARWVFWRWQRISRADEQPYLIRLVLFRCPWFAVYLHKFLGSDDACLHDHPWPFLSLVLWGGYGEWFQAPGGGRRFVWRRPGSLAFRPAHWAHRVALGLRRTPHGCAGERPAYTLVVTGRKCRSWGFHTPLGWIPWRKYHYAEHCPSD